MASFLSIFALNPPLTHFSALALPILITPVLTRCLPVIAAARAPTPRINGVAMFNECEGKGRGVENGRNFRC